MAKDEPNKATNGYSQPTMTFPPATPNEYQIFGEAGRILFGLAEDKISLGIFSFTEKETPGNLKIRYTQM